jgi:fucose 4-O-acetylase-like acetyltransferase
MAGGYLAGDDYSRRVATPGHPSGNWVFATNNKQTGARVMTTSTSEALLGLNPRLHWMDNLRSIIIFLVVLYHIGGVYESAGLWGSFWIVDDPTTMIWVGIMGIAFDIFVMPMLFFLSGYLTPASLARRSAGRFVLGKFKRLIIPWYIAVLALIPMYKVIFLYSRNLPQEHWSTYFHITSQNSQNWLWFLPVLFIFNIVYVLLTKMNLKMPRVSPGLAIVAALIIGFLYSYGMGYMVGFRSWTLTPLLDFENERLLLYFLCFLLGALFYKQGVFADKPGGKKLYNTVNAIAWLPVTAHIFVRLIPFISGGDFSVTPVYRLMWWISFDLSLLCLMYVMVETFRRYFDETGKTWSWLNRNSYGVYIIHVIMIGVFATLLMKLGWPVYVKYPLVIVLTYVGSNLLVSAYKNTLAAIVRG